VSDTSTSSRHGAPQGAIDTARAALGGRAFRAALEVAAKRHPPRDAAALAATAERLLVAYFGVDSNVVRVAATWDPTTREHVIDVCPRASAPVS
jgi:hypothetical protein